MNGASVGAVTGARAAYDIHNSTSNQENQGPRKVSNSTVRQRSNSNLRSPLSALPAGRVGTSDHGQTPQQRSQDRAEDMGQTKGRNKNGLEVEPHHNLYKGNASNGNLSNAGSDDIPENMYRPDRDDIEGWIHREKLAKIENEELQAAGINLAKARSRSNDALGHKLRTASRDQLRNDFAASDASVRDDKRRKVSSPVPSQLDQIDNPVERENWDLRSPEEIATDHTEGNTYATPVLRKSGSKIPILSPTSSHVTPERGDADTPISRKRTMSGGSLSPEEGLNVSKLRKGDSRYNEDTEGSTQAATRKPSSPTKTRQKSVSGGPAPAGAAKTPVSRKTSTTTKATPTSPNGRPRTRGNDSDRPRTAVNRPEGDPPWLADMYKPDPRLPPDQQLIPTLAKKQRQMQWEEQGMIPKTYDKEFTALAVHDPSEAANSRHYENDTTQERPDESESWPLKPTASARSTKESPSKSGTTNAPAVTGGYSTMPKVSSPPMSMTSPKIDSPPNANVGAPSPNIGPSRQTSATQQPKEKIQQRPMSDEEDEKAQKKGCACCIVM